MYSGGNLKLYITLRKFYGLYYLFSDRLMIELYIQLTQLHPVSTRCHMPRIHDALLLPLIAPYSHEKRLNGTLYHSQRKPLKNAFKRVISLSSETTLLFLYLFIHSCLFLEYGS